MLVKNINFAISLTNIEDIYDNNNNNIDVSIKLEDESEYTVIIGTPKKFLDVNK